jgi:adenosine deaminase
VVGGIGRALADGVQTGITSRLIMCFLRHLSADDAMAALEQALPHKDHIFGVGLDSSEVGNPPQKFEAVYARAAVEGFHAVAHAGEEGPPEYIWEALDVLGVQRIDHGVRCLEDRRLVQRLATDNVPLTVCPFSNVKLRVVDRLQDHPIVRMLDGGLCASVNSDDPAYFGGYVGENLAAVASTFSLDDDTLAELARNSFRASFLDDATKAAYLAEIEAALRANA